MLCKLSVVFRALEKERKPVPREIKESSTMISIRCIGKHYFYVHTVLRVSSNESLNFY